MAEVQKPTRQRLLEAAETLFSQRGFEGVTIRDLAAAAQVNVAAVNYHFTSKEKLYREVLLHTVRSIRDEVVTGMARVVAQGGGHPDRRELVRTYVASLFTRAMQAHDGEASLSPLLREMHDLRCGGKALFTELIMPINNAFREALALACPRLDELQIRWIISSIVGQIIHLVMRWHRSHQVFADDAQIGEIIRTLFPPLSQPADQYVQASIEHVTAFSLGGIAQLEAAGPVADDDREHS